MKSLILATAAVLALGAGVASAAPVAPQQAAYTQNAGDGSTVVYSGGSNQVFPGGN